MHSFSHNAGKYGLVMVILNILYVLFMHYSGQYGSEYRVNPLDLLFIIIAPFIVWWFGIEEKKKSQRGKLTFRDGFAEGFQISLVYALLSPFVFAFYYLVLNPRIVTSIKSQYGLPGASDIQIFFIDMLAQFVSAIVFGTLYAAIISFFLKTRKR